MTRTAVGLFLIALTTLLLELSLIRVFDVIWQPNMAYMVITLAMFCFALAGVYLSLRPIKRPELTPRYLAIFSALFALSSVLLLPGVNYLPFEVTLFDTRPVWAFFLFLVLYLMLAIPFFLSGLIITTIFAFYHDKIQRLYFWDLVGAGIGSILLIPLIPYIGPGGMLFLAFMAGMVASGLFLGNRTWLIIATISAIIVGSLPFLKDGYYDFRILVSKRTYMASMAQGRLESSYWDPISRIDAFNWGGRKELYYDGGNQISVVINFDGDFAKLRKERRALLPNHFTHPGVYAAHYLKRDQGSKVLIIGAAGGQETKAALLYGASHVDSIDLVKRVIDLGKTTYAKFNGGIFLDPRTNVLAGEGRSFLRASGKTYDIIQMFSNHTSSSIAGGNGAMSPLYLQTVEAYEDYFSHLSEDGILSINHHVYPRMIATAAAAWKKLGRSNFEKHVLVYESKAKNFQDNLPTTLIKMSPWTEQEVNAIGGLMFGIKVIDPLNPDNNFLSPAFFSGELAKDIIDKAPYQLEPPTDNKPYFNFLRKKIGEVQADASRFTNFSTASLLNSQQSRAGIPRDILHLVVTGSAALVFTALFLFVPLMFSRAGRRPWSGRAATLGYFACLGAGFIIVELILIQLFMKLIGYPLYTYSSVVFALLLSAGIGSWASEKMKISDHQRWYWPFIMVLVLGTLLILSHHSILSLFLTSPLPVRVLVSVALISPLGFFMGMPLPLGILSIHQETESAIPWAWGMNGLFTVIGGFLSVVISIFMGFQVTLVAALIIYLIAALLFSRLRVAN